MRIHAIAGFVVASVPQLWAALVPSLAADGLLQNNVCGPMLDTTTMLTIADHLGQPVLLH
jgi:hypothetical protein